MNLPFRQAKSGIPKIDKKGWKRLRQHPEIRVICRELGIKEAANDNRSYSTHWSKIG